MCTAIDETSTLLKRSNKKLVKKVTELERSMSKDRQLVSRVDELARTAKQSSPVSRPRSRNVSHDSGKKRVQSSAKKPSKTKTMQVKPAKKVFEKRKRSSLPFSLSESSSES